MLFSTANFTSGEGVGFIDIGDGVDVGILVISVGVSETWTDFSEHPTKITTSVNRKIK